MHISTQQNPTYFHDLKGPSNEFSGRNRKTELSSCSLPIHENLESRENEEVDQFFAEEPELNNDKDTPNTHMHRTSLDHKNERSSLSSLPQRKNHTETGLGFGKKITQLFWKPKSKSLVGSENSSSGGLTSPAFTHDSNLSIYANSLDSDSHSSSHSTSMHSTSDPISSNLFYMNTSTTMEDQFCTYSYDDCQRYATNMYYNVGEGSSFCRTLGLRPRNNSVPITSKATKLIYNSHIEDGTPSSYYNTNFSTFPNPRRHSIASSSTSSKGHDLEENTRDGYLVPIKTQKPCCLKTQDNFYVNESISDSDISQVNVHANIHTPTSLDATEISFTQICGQNIRSSHEIHPQSSNDSSSSTMVDMTGSSQEKQSRDKASTLYSNRILLSGTDCEPYCSLCASSVKAPTAPFSSKTSRMDVAIVSSHRCFFSKKAEGQLKGFFLKIVGSDGQKLDIRLQSYDLKDIDQHKVAAEVHRSKVQIVIISNHFLERLKDEAMEKKKISPLNRVLRPNRVITVLVSLSSKDIIEGYQNVLARFCEWHTLELKATGKLDPEFCKAFADQVVRIYNAEFSTISHFSVFPKKVTKEQPKIVIMFKKPIETADSLRIELTRGRQTEHVNGMISTNPYTAIIRVPDSLCQDRTALIEISVYVNNNLLGAKLIKCEYQAKQFEEDGIERMIQALPGFRKTLDEHISQKLSKDFRSNQDFSLDPELELMNDVLICKGDIFPTITHFAAYYGLEQTVWVLLEEGDGLEHCRISNDEGDTPLTISQTRGFQASIGQTINDYQEVTVSWRAFQYMKHLYERHSEDTDVNKSDEQSSDDGEFSISRKVVYSNVKFSEDDNQDNLAGSVVAKERDEYNTFKNIAEIEVLDVLEIEENSCHELSPSVTHIHEEKLSVANSILQTYDIPPPAVLLFETKPSDGNGLIYYDTPRPSQEDYCIPPTDPKPILPEKRLFINPVLTKKTNTISSDPDGYIVVDPCGSIISTSEPDIGACKQILSTFPLSKVDSKYPEIKAGQSDFSSKLTSPQPSKQVILDPTEEELVELMNGFKNNVYSMRELELLFENWKTRSDVQRDFKDRQKQLKSTRDHYKKIQETMRRNNKNFSPLDRFLKFIPGSSRKKHSTASLPISPAIPLLQREEPSRKISSDRTSIQSGGSIPDSGLSDADSDKDKMQGVGPVFWKNSHDRRFVASYVAPTQHQIVSSSQPRSEDNFIVQTVDSPPPRPFKKPSLISDCPSAGLSPPVSPFLNKRPPPQPPVVTSNTTEKTTISKLQKKNSKTTKFQPPAPPPPPRSTKNRPSFSYVSYQSNINIGTWELKNAMKIE